MLFRVVRRLRRLRQQHAASEVIVLGDSHARVFRHWWFDVLFPRTRFDVCVVGGATASGLENPNSKTQAYSIFHERLTKAAGKPVICLLGEVDTGFVIWLRAQRHDTSVDEMLQLTLATYTRFLEDVQQVASSVIVISAPLPTIGDGAPRGEIANARREVTATRAERTALTMRFNEDLEKQCRTRGVHFISLDAACIGANGEVRRELLNPDPTDHHFAFEPYARLIGARLWPVLLDKLPLTRPIRRRTE